MPRLLRGMPPAPPPERVSDEESPKCSEAVVNAEMFEKQYGVAPAQPGDYSRIWGFNSLAHLPAFGGKVSEAAAEQSGYRMPQCVKKEKCGQSGVRFAASDYDASFTVNGAQKVDAAPGNKKKMYQVVANAAAAGELFRPRFRDYTFDDKASEQLVGDVERYAGGYE